jgi:hypothetical protein
MKPYKLEPEDGFYNISVPMHKTALMELYEQGELKTVQRGYDASTGFGQEIELTEEDLQTLEEQLQEIADTPEQGSN